MELIFLHARGHEFGGAKEEYYGLNVCPSQFSYVGALTLNVILEDTAFGR